MAATVVEVRGAFSLPRARAFLDGFAPLGLGPDDPPDRLRLAFVPDGGTTAAGACVYETDGAIAIEPSAAGGDEGAVVRQAARMLSLDVDARGYAEIGERDPAIGALQRRHEGFRPVAFTSPFEAGAWFLLSHRVRMAQAVAVKRRLTDELGEEVEVDGVRRRAFPPPERIAGLEAFGRVPERKVANLRALARAALEGRLHGDRLRAMDPDEALAELQTLPGVGPFTAQGILVRGANAPDALALDVPRLGAEVAHVLGLDAPPDRARLVAISDGWRPFRAWVQVLLHIGMREARASPDGR